MRLKSVQLLWAEPHEIVMLSADWCEAQLDMCDWIVVQWKLLQNWPRVRLAAPRIKALLMGQRFPASAFEKPYRDAVDVLRTRNIWCQTASTTGWRRQRKVLSCLILRVTLVLMNNRTLKFSAWS